MKPATTVLFLCTGNYYRSRLAEHYFNVLAVQHSLAWRAESRGMRVNPDNVGPMSQEALRWLRARDIALPEPLRYPLAVTDADLASAALVIAVKEAEHRPYLERLFPARVDSVEFWHVHDLDVATAEEALPVLAAKVEDLVRRLSA
jgi:protein-tyrosine phosphatase